MYIRTCITYNGMQKPREKATRRKEMSTGFRVQVNLL